VNIKFVQPDAVSIFQVIFAWGLCINKILHNNFGSKQNGDDPGVFQAFCVYIIIFCRSTITSHGNILTHNFFLTLLMIQAKALEACSTSITKTLKISTILRKILFFKHFFSPINTLVRKEKDPDPDPYLRIPLIRFRIRIPNTAKKYCFTIEGP
jgi:hypothetical protein